MTQNTIDSIRRKMYACSRIDFRRCTVQSQSETLERFVLSGLHRDQKQGKLMNDE